MQIYRWRNSDVSTRATALAISPLLLFFMAIGAVICAWIYYCYRYHQLEQVLNLQRFWPIMSARLAGRVTNLIYVINPLYSVFAEDMILLFIGGFAFLPILYGTLQRRESICLAMMAILPWFLAMWLLSGFYLLVPILALAFTWVCNAFAQREYPSLTIGFTVLTVFGFLAEYYI